MRIGNLQQYLFNQILIGIVGYPNGNLYSRACVVVRQIGNGFRDELGIRDDNVNIPSGVVTTVERMLMALTMP